MGVDFGHMDKAFRSGLRDYRQSAPDDIWENIDQRLNEKSKIKWFNLYKVAATVAAFAIIGSVYFYFSHTKKQLIDKSELVIAQNNNQAVSHNTQNEVADIQKTTKETESINAFEKKNYKEEDAVVKEIHEAIVGDDEAIHDIAYSKHAEIEKLYALQISIDQKRLEYNIVDLRKEQIRSYLNSLPDLYSFYAINDVVEQEKPKEKNWSVGGEFTPLYSYRYITETNNDYSKSDYNQVESPIMSYTGGLNVQYKVFEKLTIQAGVYYSSMGQSLDYMSVYSNHAYDLVAEEYKDRYVNSYEIENSIGTMSFNTKYVFVDNKSLRVNNLSDNKDLVDVNDPIFDDTGAEIQQSFKYIEVPFLFRYKIIDKTVDLNLIGGIGANFLIGNDVYLIYGGNKEIVGKTEGVNTINYSSNIGFGIEYPIWQRVNIRIEPSVKYYLNAINSGSDVESHPYSFGLYTGINYSF